MKRIKLVLTLKIKVTYQQKCVYLGIAEELQFETNTL